MNLSRKAIAHLMVENLKDIKFYREQLEHYDHNIGPYVSRTVDDELHPIYQGNLDMCNEIRNFLEQLEKEQQV